MIRQSRTRGIGSAETFSPPRHDMHTRDGPFSGPLFLFKAHMIIEQAINAIATFVLDTIHATGYAGVFVLMLLESANVPIPSEIIMPFAGFLTIHDTLSFWPIVFWGAFGNLVGSLISYGIARRFRTSQRMLRFFLVTTEDVERGEWLFRHFGIVTAFFSRLIPIVRTFISFPAGLFRAPLWQFTILTFIGSFLWSWFLTGLGVILGENWHAIEQYVRILQYPIAAAIVIGVVYWIYHHVRIRNKTHG